MRNRLFLRKSSLCAHQEALAALLLFWQAAEAEEVTLGLVERIAVYLQRARNNPELRFGEEVRP
jgi:hypothetical protein